MIRLTGDVQSIRFESCTLWRILLTTKPTKAKHVNYNHVFGVSLKKNQHNFVTTGHLNREGRLRATNQSHVLLLPSVRKHFSLQILRNSSFRSPIENSKSSSIKKSLRWKNVSNARFVCSRRFEDGFRHSKSSLLERWRIRGICVSRGEKTASKCYNWKTLCTRWTCLEPLERIKNRRDQFASIRGLRLKSKRSRRKMVKTALNQAVRFAFARWRTSSISTTPFEPVARLGLRIRPFGKSTGDKKKAPRRGEAERLTRVVSGVGRFFHGGSTCPPY